MLIVLDTICIHFYIVCLGQENFTSPVSPAELLIALHSVDPSKVDVKTIIKGYYVSAHLFTERKTCQCILFIKSSL